MAEQGGRPPREPVIYRPVASLGLVEKEAATGRHPAARLGGYRRRVHAGPTPDRRRAFLFPPTPAERAADKECAAARPPTLDRTRIDGGSGWRFGPTCAAPGSRLNDTRPRTTAALARLCLGARCRYRVVATRHGQYFLQWARFVPFAVRFSGGRGTIGRRFSSRQWARRGQTGQAAGYGSGTTGRLFIHSARYQCRSVVFYTRDVQRNANNLYCVYQLTFGKMFERINSDRTSNLDGKFPCINFHTLNTETCIPIHELVFIPSTAAYFVGYSDNHSAHRRVQSGVGRGSARSFRSGRS